MNPELSVIIPTYKRKNSLQRLLEILLTHEKIIIEIIVVDQNTGDYFDTGLKDLLNKVKWIKQNEPNASAARNNGFLASTAPFILFIDDDLVPGADFCRNGVNIFNHFPQVECFSPLVFNDTGIDSAIEAAKSKWIAALPGNPEIFSIKDTISAAIFFKRAFFIKTGGFDDYFFDFAKTAEDQEFFLRMLKNNLQLWYVPLVQVYHDEKVPGGCDLRTDDYWITRKKCMKAWALRYRVRNKTGKIRITDFFSLCRSSFLNKEVLKSSPKYITKQYQLMKSAIRESGVFFHQRESTYAIRIKNGFLQESTRQINLNI